ncbi:18743_t:CDS:2, partial [Racocetra persica]
QQTNSARLQLSSQYGLSAKPVLDTLYWDRYLQSAQDAYHALAGKATRLLDITLRYLNTNREVAWLKCWKSIKKLARWLQIPNLLTHHHSFIFSDTLYLAMLMLFILRYFLSPSHLKAEIIEHLKNIYKLICNDHTIIKLIELLIVEAKLLKLAFSTTMTNNTYKELRSLFEKERIGFLKIFLDIFENLPNVHINVYLLQHAHTFATLVNTSVGVKEMPKTRANIEGWSTKLSSQHSLFHDLHISFSEYFSLQSAFLNNELEFFDYISYTIIENDRKST